MPETDRGEPYYLPDGLTLTDWARVSGVDPSYLLRILTQKTTGGVDTWTALARTAGCTIEELRRQVKETANNG